jgi:Rod binding domain-containing protein
MEINPFQRRTAAADIAPERLAGNPNLTQDQKVAEASRQFEAVLLHQILSDSQKTVIPSEFSDDSTAAGIYQDLITKTLADNISKSGAFGLAKTFEQQLNRHAGKVLSTTVSGAPALRPGDGKSRNPVAAPTDSSIPHHRADIRFVPQS